MEDSLTTVVTWGGACAATTSEHKKVKKKNRKKFNVRDMADTSVSPAAVAASAKGAGFVLQNNSDN